MKTGGLKDFQAELEELADVVESKWEKQQFELEAFPQLCEELLRSFTPINVPDVPTIISDLSAVKLPTQTFPNNEFSELPLSLVRRKNFIIDIYFWIESDTNIHDHNFCGAFKVIKGNSYQVDYTFEAGKQLGEGFEEGVMTIKNHRALSTNDVQRIEPWDSFIHHVFHIEKPTITLCIRTDFFPKRPLFCYFFPKYRLLFQNVSLPHTKWIKGLEVSIQLGIPVSDSDVPLSETDIVKCLYMARMRRFTISQQAWSFLFDLLKKTAPDLDFFTVFDRQNDHQRILKNFAFVSREGNE